MLVESEWSWSGVGIMDSERITVRASDPSGLNPNRQMGFRGNSAIEPNSRIETSTSSKMQAKQGSIVARFMTFLQRKSSLVIELFNGVSYKEKPIWDKISEFICNDLCLTVKHRRSVREVQFHPVKMLIFVKCVGDNHRDFRVSRLQSP